MQLRALKQFASNQPVNQKAYPSVPVANTSADKKNSENSHYQQTVEAAWRSCNRVEVVAALVSSTEQLTKEILRLVVPPLSPDHNRMARLDSLAQPRSQHLV